MKNEIWKTIPGYNGNYAASSLGRIKRTTPGKRTYAGRLLQPWASYHGYMVVQIRRDGKSLIRKVHNLVMEAHVGPRQKLEVNHIDGDKSNNKIENLEYVTHSENIRHAFRLGLHSTRGERHPQAKINYEVAQQIRDLIPTKKQADIARMFNVSPQTVYNIKNNKQWVQTLI